MGLGRIGAKMAQIAQAFDMKLLAWSANMTAERAAACGATLVSRDELLARADFVSSIWCSVRARAVCSGAPNSRA